MIFSHTEPRNETSDQTELLNTKYLSNCLYVLEGRGGKEGQEGVSIPASQEKEPVIVTKICISKDKIMLSGLHSIRTGTSYWAT